jgi:hypothetical protein
VVPLRKTTENLSLDSTSLSRDLEAGPTKYEVGDYVLLWDFHSLSYDELAIKYALKAIK